MPPSLVVNGYKQHVAYMYGNVVGVGEHLHRVGGFAGSRNVKLDPVGKVGGVECSFGATDRDFRSEQRSRRSLRLSWKLCMQWNGEANQGRQARDHAMFHRSLCPV